MMPLLLGAKGSAVAATVAYHRLCCAQKGPLLLPPDSGDLVKDWALTLNQLTVKKCSHTFGVGSLVSDFDDEEVEHDHDDRKWPPQVAHVEEWMFAGQHFPPANDVEVLSDVATCAAIQLIEPLSEPLTSNVEFFTPKMIDGLTKGSPFVRIETGTTYVGGTPKELRYSLTDSRFYKDGTFFKVGRERIDDFSVVTQETLKEFYPQSMSSLALTDFVPFLEYATNSRAPSREEAGALIFSDQLDGMMTTDKLRAIDISKSIDSVWRELGRPKQMLWFRRVPLSLLNPIAARGSRRRSSGSTKRSRSPVKPSSSGLNRSRSPERMSDLSLFLRNKKLIDQTLRRVIEANARFNSRSSVMRNAFASTEMEDRMSLIGEEQMGSQRSSEEQNNVTAQRVAAFLLVNSMLAASETSYAEVIGSIVQERLQKSNHPIFSVCAPRVNIKQPVPVSENDKWLHKNLRFSIADSAMESLTVDYDFRRLADVEVGALEQAECVILALVGIEEEEFKSLRRRPVDVLFAFVTHRFISMESGGELGGKAIIEEEKGLSRRAFNRLMRRRPERGWDYTTRQSAILRKVDLWKFFGAKDDGLSIAELFSNVGEIIRCTGNWPPKK